MVRDDIVRTIQPVMPELRRRFHVRAIGLFGSIARGSDRPNSDVDVLVEFEPGAMVTLFTLAGLRIRLMEFLGREVDVIEDHAGLRPAFRESLKRDYCRVA